MHKLFGVQGSWIFLTLTFWVSCGVKFKGFLGLKVRSYHWARRAGSKISFRRREDASSPPQRRSVAASRHREDASSTPSSVAASQHRENAKTRAAPQRRGSVAASRRREDARRPQRRGSVAASRRREDTRRPQRRGSVAASQRRDTAKTRAAPSAASQWSRSPPVAYSKIKTRMPCLLSCQVFPDDTFGDAFRFPRS